VTQAGRAAAGARLGSPAPPAGAALRLRRPEAARGRVGPGPPARSPSRPGDGEPRLPVSRCRRGHRRADRRCSGSESDRARVAVRYVRVGLARPGPRRHLPVLTRLPVTVTRAAGSESWPFKAWRLTVAQLSSPRLARSPVTTWHPDHCPISHCSRYRQWAAVAATWTAAVDRHQQIRV
jgi:hypothetical protein